MRTSSELALTNERVESFTQEDLFQLSHEDKVGRQLDPNFHQLTGTFLRYGQVTGDMVDLPDPAPPFVTSHGEVEIYGSCTYFIRYKSWWEFERGGRYECIPLNLYFHNGEPVSRTYTHPWDLRKYHVIDKHGRGEDVLVGGTMSPSRGRKTPVWPHDNPSRRLFLFRPDGRGGWKSDPKPLIGNPKMGWVGHSYGGNFYQQGSPFPQIIDFRRDEPVYFFYEKVTKEFQGTPYRTEMFLRRMKDPVTADGPELPVLKIKDTPFPSVRRTIGGYLIEGPRPHHMRIDEETFYIVGFSSGDFPTDSYSLNYAWSKHPEGPYTPAVDSHRRDLHDISAQLKTHYHLSWVGRPCFYTNPRGELEVLFHAVNKQILPNHDYTQWPKNTPLWGFFRSIYKLKLHAQLSESGRISLAPHLDFDVNASVSMERSS